MQILILLVIALIIYVINKAPERAAHHYLPPQGMETNWAAIQRDLASGMPKREINKKIASGGYVVPKNKK